MKTQKDKEQTDGDGLEDFGISNDILGDINDFFSHENFNRGDIFTAGQASNWDVDLVCEDDDPCASGSVFELNEIETSIIQFSKDALRKRRTGGKSPSEKKIYITHEDFEEGPERDAFLLVFGYAERLFKPFKKDRRQESIEFFFCNQESQISFEEAAGAINHSIRVDVIRLRIMLEFWFRDWSFGDLPSTAVILPTRIELMALQYAGMIGFDIAREAWFYPGISSVELIDRVRSRNQDVPMNEIDLAIKNLLAYYVISKNQHGDYANFYTTGQNPFLKSEEMMRSRGIVSRSAPNIRWSKMF
jgi:hypothetical protein